MYIAERHKQSIAITASFRPPTAQPAPVTNFALSMAAPAKAL